MEHVKNTHIFLYIRIPAKHRGFCISHRGSSACRPSDRVVGGGWMLRMVFFLVGHAARFRTGDFAWISQLHENAFTNHKKKLASRAIPAKPIPFFNYDVIPQTLLSQLSEEGIKFLHPCCTRGFELAPSSSNGPQKTWQGGEIRHDYWPNS
ncbi:hypothetical protein JTE90_014554 [Oedothorax gibbosus]|uniref:Uncharacterized protein n=1 Tax=Oedothorax gibbosus TaxID=931172 RepID=A0AAV6UDU5_9ARAC|nr:hypothetical protein JTE90_014554 [Oedothorax gibbosus]